MLRFARVVDTLNIAGQLLVGALLVAGIDLWFISQARAGYATTPPWLIVAIPVGVTLLWLIGASIALRVVLAQRRQSHQRDTVPTESADS